MAPNEKKTIKTTKTYWLFFFLIFNFLVHAQTVTFTSFPRDIQLFTRNKTTNIATVPISGSINASTGYTSVVLQLYKNNQLQNSIAQNLSYNSGIATFNFSISLNAELSNYTFRLLSNTNLVLKEANSVTAGDVYVISGQSNSVFNTGDPQTGNNFIITYKSNAFQNTNQNIGSIGYNFINQLVTEKQIPVFVVNGGEGGKPISYFQRDATNSYNSSTNYGRLLTRYTAAGFTPSDVTAIIWYQGESNGSDSKSYYLDSFNYLYNCWKQDYNPSHFYVFQVHRGCGIDATSQIPEALRQLPILIPDLQVISTNGIIQGVDNCHCIGTNGYTILAERLYKLINHDIYGAQDTLGIYSPNITNCSYTPNYPKLSFELIPASDSYSFEAGVHSDFFFENSPITILSGSVTGNKVTLLLSEPIQNDNIKLSYLGSLSSSPHYIKNQNNIGLLSFKSILVLQSLPRPPITGDILKGTYTYNDINRDPEGTSTFKWYVADDVSGTNQTAIAGATDATFTVTNTQGGKYVGFGVTPKALTGTTTGTEVVYYATTPSVALGSFSFISVAQVSKNFCRNRGMDNTDTISVTINVTTAGGISFSTNTVNGYHFTGSGVFPTGSQTIILSATGTQTAYNVGGDAFTITGIGVNTQTTTLTVTNVKSGADFTAHFNGITSEVSANNLIATYSSGETFNNNITCFSKPISASACSGTTITIGSNIYSIANINGQCWMTKNIKELPNGVAVNTSQWLAASQGDLGYYGYYNTTNSTGSAGWGTTEPAAGEGLLYQWSAAMLGSTTERAQGICPIGWHIPSDCEWMYLEHGMGMSLSQQVNYAERSNTNDNQGTPGYKLRSQGTGQTNASGFSGLLAGIRINTDGTFIIRNSYSVFWTSSTSSATSSIGRLITSDSSASRSVGRTAYNNATGYSVRCLKD